MVQGAFLLAKKHVCVNSALIKWFKVFFCWPKSMCVNSVLVGHSHLDPQWQQLNDNCKW